MLAPVQRERHGRKPPASYASTCPKCSKAMHFIVLETGGRKFQCVQCDGVDPMRLSDIQALIKGELQPPRALRLKDRSDPITQLVAEKIIAIGRLGIEDPTEISKLALKELWG